MAALQCRKAASAAEDEARGWSRTETNTFNFKPLGHRNIKCVPQKNNLHIQYLRLSTC